MKNTLAEVIANLDGKELSREKIEEDFNKRLAEIEVLGIVKVSTEAKNAILGIIKNQEVSVLSGFIRSIFSELKGNSIKTVKDVYRVLNGDDEDDANDEDGTGYEHIPDEDEESSF